MAMDCETCHEHSGLVAEMRAFRESTAEALGEIKTDVREIRDRQVAAPPVETKEPVWARFLAFGLGIGVPLASALAYLKGG